MNSRTRRRGGLLVWLFQPRMFICGCRRCAGDPIHQWSDGKVFLHQWHNQASEQWRRDRIGLRRAIRLRSLAGRFPRSASVLLTVGRWLFTLVVGIMSAALLLVIYAILVAILWVMLTGE